MAKIKTKEKNEPEVKIGLEIHCQLNTNTKMFCSCATRGNDEPNTRTCVICLGMPGSKPVLNKKALQYGIKIGLALNCKILEQIRFSRKTYFYPDMAKNYQITQYELPLGINGKLVLSSGKEIRIQRVHLEEDPAALVHPAGMQESSYVLVDYNRSGNPLVEIVTEPGIVSPEEARDFLNQLLKILNTVEVFDQQHAVLRTDANVSLKETSYAKTEMKEVSSFKEVERAISYEIMRQKKLVQEGQTIRHETLTWDSEKQAAFVARTKETEDDYGYIFDPDLPLIEIGKDEIKEAFVDMPELPREKTRRFTKQYGIKEETAAILASDKALAYIFEKTAKKANAKKAAEWIRTELVRVLVYQKKTLEETGINEHHIIDLLALLEKKEITEKTAKHIMEKLSEEVFDVKEHVKEKDLGSVSNIFEIEQHCREAIAENKKAADDYKKGSEKALNFIVGAVMKKSKGKAEPGEVKKIIKRIIG